MRDLVFTLFIIVGLIATLRSPFIGLMLWVLLSIMNPHQETYFVKSVQWNLIVVIVTIGTWMVSQERKLPSRGITTVLVLLLLAWTTLNTFFAFDPSFSWTYWNRFWKIIAMAVVASALTTSMVRFHALIWIVAVSVGYYGVKGGLFTLLTGGHFIVLGPQTTMIGDNNTLAGALVMILPILNYLRIHSESQVIRNGIVVAIVLVVTSILGSYSRGAFIGLAALAIMFWTRAKNKLIYPVIVAIVLLPLLHFMPESFFDRAASIQDYSTDGSVQGRFDSWWVAYSYALDHFPFGAGVNGMVLRGVWAPYLPGIPYAAHSIYFQVLGEEGVVGLVLYLLILVSTFYNFRAVARSTKNVPDLAWARDLAQMMQLSLLAFCVCGAALPLDFFDVFFLWALLSATLRQVTQKGRQTLAVPSPFVRNLAPAPRPLGIPPT